MIRALCILMCVVPLAAKGQFTYSLDQSIPVTGADGNALANPWLGGINAAQFSTMDLNGDGREDLVLFDRMANKVITLLAENNRYVPAPEYESLFPDGISNWLLLRDYNCDGRKDIFTGDILGMKVYTNVSTDDGLLRWEPYLFDTGFDGSESHVVMTENPATQIKVNIQLQYDDLPAIVDVDGDGDLDILNIQYMGSTIEFHRNMAVERGLPCDVMDFVRVTRAWGNLRECYCGVFAYNGQSCPPDVGRVQHAGGKTLTVMDINGDGAPDVLLSEADCTLLYATLNEGTAHAPVFNNSFAFPPGQPVNFVFFPAAFYEDVDFDGVKDLISTPNVFSKEYLNSFFDRSTWFYKNTGTTASPSFQLTQQDFLQRDMIDLGDNAVPALVDTDGDGDLDLLVSSNSSTTYSARIFHFENIGSPGAPEFRMVNDDYLGFSDARFYNLKIQFTDFDGNGTDDLLFTATSFDNGGTQLYLLANSSQSRLDFSNSSLETLPFALTYTENVLVADINADGLPDILAGRSEGNLEYWKNTGIAGAPAFTLEEENFLGLDTSPLRQNISCAIADVDGDGLSDLLLGDNTGRLTIVSSFTDDPIAVNEIIHNPILQTYTYKNLGGQIWPVVGNLFKATKPAIVVGNHLGGIHVLRHDEGVTLPENPAIDLFPNPVALNGTLHIKVDRTATVQVFSVLGQRIGEPIIVRPYQTQSYSVTSLATGLYLARFTVEGKTFVRRFVVH